MVKQTDIESMLTEIAKPRVLTGDHCAELREQLLRSVREGEPRRRASRPRWALAACCGILLAAASGWGAQQLYLRYFLLEDHTADVRVMPDGSLQLSSWSAVLTTDDPTMTQQQAKDLWEELKQAMVDGEYFLQDIQEMPSGELLYIYWLPTGNGGYVPFGTTHPLP